MNNQSVQVPIDHFEGKFKTYIQGGTFFCHKIHSMKKRNSHVKVLTELETTYDDVVSSVKEQVATELAEFKSRIITKQEMRNRISAEVKRILGDTDEVNAFLLGKTVQDIEKMHKKVSRFRRIVEMNIIHCKYFCTFTMNDNFSSDEEFVSTLTTLFRNLRYTSMQKGWEDHWRFIGGWEEGELNGRLHWHGFVCIPKEDPRGRIERRTQYSTKRHRLEEIDVLPYFDERTGTAQVEKICSRRELRKATGYACKYITKNADMKFFYSRGLQHESILEFDERADFLFEQMYYGQSRYRIMDDVDVFSLIEELTKARRERLLEERRARKMKKYDEGQDAYDRLLYLCQGELAFST